MSKKRQKLLDRLECWGDFLSQVEQAFDDVDAVGPPISNLGFDRSLREADRGRFATDNEMEDAFASFRRA